MEGHREQLRRKVVTSIVFTLGLVLMPTAIPVVGAFAQDQDAPIEAAPPTAEEADMAKWGFMAAALAFGFGALGAGIGIANVGAAAMGAVSEKPEIAGQALIFIALAEGLVVFGFITALIILGRI
ncbi:MAG: ATP synthase subunit C [Spirochaetota bacterium]